MQPFNFRFVFNPKYALENLLHIKTTSKQGCLVLVYGVHGQEDSDTRGYYLTSQNNWDIP